MTKAAYDKIAAGLEDAMALTTPEVQAAVERVTAILHTIADGSYNASARIYKPEAKALLAALAASEERRVELEGENAMLRGLLAPPKGEDVPVAWVTKEALIGLSKPRVSESVTKLTHHAQPEYGFTQPLYARPTPEVSDEMVTAALNAIDPDGREWVGASETRRGLEAALALLSRGNGF